MAIWFQNITQSDAPMSIFDSSNETSSNRTFLSFPMQFPMSYRIVATVIHVIILFMGLFGNVAVVVVVRKTRSMHTPTYCYLVSLAIADLIVLMSAMPEAILSHHLYSHQYILGHAGCAILTFANFLGINASSMSILCFTIERYIAICKPLLAQKVCSVERARSIIIITWILTVLYSSPWLGLAVTESANYSGAPTIHVERCGFRLDRKQFIYFFMTDLVLFYILPLAASAAVYAKIGMTLRQSRDIRHYMKTTNQTSEGRPLKKPAAAGSAPTNQDRSTVQVVWMLLFVVILFAVLWLPYRALLVYNSFVARPWRNIWYLLFAKSAVFLNSAINPIMYNAISKRFRAAFMHHIFCAKNVIDPPEITWTRTSVATLWPSSSGMSRTPRGSMQILNPNGNDRFKSENLKRLSINPSELSYGRCDFNLPNSGRSSPTVTLKIPNSLDVPRPNLLTSVT